MTSGDRTAGAVHSLVVDETPREGGDTRWIDARGRAQTRPLEAVATDGSEAMGIRLENGSAYDWIVFLPRRDGDADTVANIFGGIPFPRRDGPYCG